MDHATTDGTCIICTEPFSPQNLLSAICCNHRSVCSICFLRIRALQRNMGCPECKTNLDHVICLPCDGSSASEMSWSDFTIWGDSCGPDFTLDPRSQIFFPKQYFRSKVESLWACKCSLCGQSKRDMKALKAHYNGDHNMHMCALCIEFKQSFPSEQKVYTQQEYETHLRKGDKDGSEGHPNCEFCRKRFYDKTALFIHMSRDHYTCHLCERQGIQFKYYHEYANVEAHYRKEHYICEDPACLQKRFIAFTNEFDLTAHTVQWHPMQNVSRKIPIRFKVRGNSSRMGASGAAAGASDDEGDDDGAKASSSSRGGHAADGRFDGGTGGSAHGGEWQIELPPSARDPRDALRAEAHLAAADASAFASSAFAAAAAEEFPSLLSGGGASTTLGWGVGPGAGKKKGDKDFPALLGSSEAKMPTRDLWEPVAAAAAPPQPVSLGAAVGGWARLKTDKRFAKGKKSSSALDLEAQSFKDAIDASRSLAVRIHLGQVDPYAAAAPPPAPAKAIAKSQPPEPCKAAPAKAAKESKPAAPAPTPTPAPTPAPTPTPAATPAATLAPASAPAPAPPPAPTPTPPPAAPKAKKAVSAPPPSVAGWSTAFQAVGLAAASTSKKVKGLSVVKAKVSAADSRPLVTPSSVLMDTSAPPKPQKATEPAQAQSSFRPPPPGLSVQTFPFPVSSEALLTPPAPPGLQKSASFSSLDSGSGGRENVSAPPAARILAAPAAAAAAAALLGPPPGLSGMGWTKVGGSSGSREAAGRDSSGVPSPDFPSLPGRPVVAEKEVCGSKAEPWKPIPQPAQTPKQKTIGKKEKKDLLQLAFGIKR